MTSSVSANAQPHPAPMRLPSSHSSVRCIGGTGIGHKTFNATNALRIVFLFHSNFSVVSAFEIMTVAQARGVIYHLGCRRRDHLPRRCRLSETFKALVTIAMDGFSLI